jgi:hypothetical protein
MYENEYVLALMVILALAVVAIIALVTCGRVHDKSIARVAA